MLAVEWVACQRHPTSANGESTFASPVGGGIKPVTLVHMRCCEATILLSHDNRLIIPSQVPGSKRMQFTGGNQFGFGSQPELVARDQCRMTGTIPWLNWQHGLV